MEVIASWHVLMHYAHLLGQARLSKDENLISKAEKDLKAYEEICLSADKISLNVTQSCMSCSE